MSIYELEQISNTFLQDNFNTSLNIPLVINGRLQKTLGRFKSTLNRITRERIPLKIELSQNLINTNDNNIIVDVLKHELIHYALCSNNQPFSDNDYIFIHTCNKMNVPLTNTIRIQRKQHIYECENGHIIKRVRRFNENNYKCKCHGKLSYKGEQFC